MSAANRTSAPFAAIAGVAAGISMLGALGLATTLAADDRALLRAGSRDPYVMIILDSSGSMNWSPPCSAADYAAGVCNFLCPSGDCPVPRDGDDPASKMRQAKEALFEVLEQVDNVHFGFSTYNQDALRVDWKTWLYQVDAVQPAGFATLAGGVQYPTAGSQEVFGATFACDRGGNPDDEIGCYAANNRAADLNDVWEMTKVRRQHKLGDAGGSTVVYYIRTGGQVYRVETLQHAAPPAPGPLGNANITLHYHIGRCTGSPLDNPTNGCNSSGEWTTIFDQSIAYTLVDSFVKWDNDVDRNLDEGGYDDVQFVGASNTCAGWDPNSDDASDLYASTYSLRFPDGATYFDAPPTGPPFPSGNDLLFQYGDVMPLNWNDSNRFAIQDRLAPALCPSPLLPCANPATDPEAFANARYLNNHRTGTNTFLRLSDPLQLDRPIFPSGSTPLGASLNSVRTWFTAWDNFAEQEDDDWQCRRKYVLLITDGDETCGGNPCTAATALFNAGVQTYVVGFGLANSATLTCIATNGGTGAPILPQNRQDLIDALTDLFDQIEEDAVAFASAAVPSVQANIADKIFLSSFTPLNDESVWPGRLDAFLKPLPLDAANLPDRSVLCQAGSVEAQCFAWDAGDSQLGWDTDTSGYNPRGLLLQAPFPESIVPGNNATLQIGTGNDERRVFFGLPTGAAAGNRQYFRFPNSTVPVEQLNFEFAWNLPPPAGSAANLAEIERIVQFTLEEKRGAIDIFDTPTNPADDQHIQYLMGDIFHSNPAVLNPPRDLDLFNKDPYYNQGLCGQDITTTRNTRGAQISYQTFSLVNFCRRAMLLTASNDGQVHVFDAGVFRGADCIFDLPPSQEGAPRNNPSDADGIEGKYDFGTGREIFSFVPGAMMPHVKELSEIGTLSTQYGVDGNMTLADVFIDPIPAGTPAQNCLDRTWRTVVLGTYREGGPGVYALDVTQPDTIGAGNVPDPIAGGYVPSCTDGGAGCGPLPFPSVLWEFADTTDEDGVGGADLAEGWSQPFVTRLLVCDGVCDAGEIPEDRWVAVFGGGLPEAPTNSAADATGNWIYMVDIETGDILYKRGGDGVISGSVAADVTGVDFNNNGYPDTLYFGTTAGILYKVDLGDGPFDIGGDGRIQDPSTGGTFDPFQILSTGGRPIYLEITAINVAKLRATGLLFGTGNRWDLWATGASDGRFFAIVDLAFEDTDGDGILDVDTVACPGCTEPLTEANFESIDPDSAFDITNPGPDYLFGNADPNKLAGYFFDLAANEKLITEPFSLSGITSFTIFDPVTTAQDGACAQGGASKIFIVNTANAVGYAIPDPSQPNTFGRYFTAPQFTTQPYSESSTTQNQGASDPDPWTDSLRRINNELRKLAPESCKFGNYSVDIRTIRSDTGIVFVAPVPVCIEVHNWKEF